MFEETFVNEIGNKITIKVSKIEKRTVPEFYQINIIGPVSEHENLITVTEFEVLKKLLDKF